MTRSEQGARRKSAASRIGVGKSGARSRVRKRAKPNKWGLSMNALKGGFWPLLCKRAVGAISGLINSTWLLSFPLVFLLLVTSTDFLILTAVSESADDLFFDEINLAIVDERRSEVELLKAQVLRYIYAAILILSMFHWREIFDYFRQWPHLVLLTVCLMCSAFVSIEPIKVLTNSAVIFTGFLSAILFAIAHSSENNYRALYTAVVVPMLVVHVASLAIFALYGTNIIDFLNSTQRYGGLAGNPNSLGVTGVLGFWAAGTLFLSRSISLFKRSLALVAIALFILHVLISGSGTSLMAVIVVTLALFWLRILAIVKPMARQVLNWGAAVLTVMLLLGVVIAATPAELYLSFTESLGKDTSLTGRTVLWQIAREAISLRPIFGWGFDSHISVMAERSFNVKFNHYHNGFMDTLIAGGAVLLIFVLYNLGQFFRLFFAGFRTNPDVFPLIVPLIILLLLNLSEYSLLRPSSQIWGVYVAAFVMLSFHQGDKPISQLFRRRKSTNSRSRKRTLRWA